MKARTERQHHGYCDWVFGSLEQTKSFAHAETGHLLESHVVLDRDGIVVGLVAVGRYVVAVESPEEHHVK